MTAIICVQFFDKEQRFANLIVTAHKELELCMPNKYFRNTLQPNALKLAFTV